MLTGSCCAARRSSRIEIAASLVAAGLVVIFLLPYRRTRASRRRAVAIIVVGSVRRRSSVVPLRRICCSTASIRRVVGARDLRRDAVGGNLRVAEQERRQLAAELEIERETKARLEGELNAARAIQMGLLPRQFPRPARAPATSRSTRSIEPARMVGGDLYDFVMLDSRHLSSRSPTCRARACRPRCSWR